jgi:formyltetrahydrofolate deformylase
MQVLSEQFLSRFPDRIINIHHSFLPAFIGGNPHKKAYDRGVKLIGATAHYTTLDLDDGPIIAQDVIQCSHSDEISDLIRKGRILERNVLLQAIESHLDDRVFVYKNRCVVFND